MEVKTLKKQLGAAIAMVLVAAVALGSATFAWFATNNKVTAKTNTISAQSNAAFMTIAAGTNGASATNNTEATTTVTDNKALYPVTYGEADANKKGTWMSAYGSTVNSSTISGKLFEVHDPLCTTDPCSEHDGGIYSAVRAGYVAAEDFNVSSRGQNLKDLKVNVVTFQGKDGSETEEFRSAFRVMVAKLNDKDEIETYVVYGYDNNNSKFVIKQSSDSGNGAVTFGDVTVGKDTALKVYLFYEGSDTNVYTEKLQADRLKLSQGVNIEFTATPANK